jgi:HPr kinase/phosphorylase
MEVRGLGIIDVKTLYGVGAVKNIKELSLIIELHEFEHHNENVTQNYVEEYKKVLGKKIKKINFYVTPGRSIASIIEILSMKFRKRS